MSTLERAIVIAALRALMSWFDVSIDPVTLAEMALAVEVEELGLAGGPMDRVIQVYEGLMLMDLREPRTAASYRLHFTHCRCSMFISPWSLV